MSWKTTRSVLIIAILIATTASADVIPFFGKRRIARPYNRSWIEFSASRLPKGTVLLIMDKDGEVLGKTYDKEVMRLHEPCTIYAAYESQLSTPFSYKKDRLKLIRLREVTDNDFPGSYDNEVSPALLNCRMIGGGKVAYTLDCSDPAAPVKPRDRK
jgi:hypothetical protein